MKMQPYGCFSFAPGKDGHTCLEQKRERNERMMPEDVHCPVCDEPWDRYGVTHGDMTEADAAAFFRGEGCPVCAFGARQHGRNTQTRMGILAQRLLAEQQKAGKLSPTEVVFPPSNIGAPTIIAQQPVKHTLQECQQIAQVIGWVIKHMDDNVYFYGNETFGAHAREDECEGFNELYDALDRIQQQMQGDTCPCRDQFPESTYQDYLRRKYIWLVAHGQGYRQKVAYMAIAQALKETTTFLARAQIQKYIGTLGPEEDQFLLDGLWDLDGEEKEQ